MLMKMNKQKKKGYILAAAVILLCIAVVVAGVVGLTGSGGNGAVSHRVGGSGKGEIGKGHDGAALNHVAAVHRIGSDLQFGSGFSGGNMSEMDAAMTAETVIAVEKIPKFFTIHDLLRFKSSKYR